MKPLHVLIALTLCSLLLLFSLPGCLEHVSDSEQIVGSGKLVTQTRILPSFSGIQVTGIAKVIIKQDSVQSFGIEADDNVVDRVTAAVSNGLLIIGLQQGSYSKVTINISASMKSIDRLECVGTADFTSLGAIRTDAIACRITGAGSMALTGTATNEVIEVTGTGDIHNFGLVSNRCAATISGLGNLEVNVTQQLDAVVSGSGSIIYMGNPSVVNKTIAGLGSVRPRL
jgi:hypothetical protein